MTEKRFYYAHGVVWDTKKPNGLNGISINDLDNGLRVANWLNELAEENEQLKSENKRLTDKLNKTALELVDVCISQGKATEISEMSYKEFLDYRAENGKPMELQL